MSIMTNSSSDLQKQWDERQALLGNTQRAVLCKNLPNWLNFQVQSQREFVLRHVPFTTRRLLDVGCGFGRMAAELSCAYPSIEIAGIELCEAFAEEFRDRYGECFHGRLEDFSSNDTYDTIVIVTLLMYLSRGDIPIELDKLWSLLRSGGRLICIEQFPNFLVRWRERCQSKFFAPTGGSRALYFGENELQQLLLELPGAKLISAESLGLFSFFDHPVLYKAVAIEKS
jgi:SAM-dependent methyltransferase